VLLQSKILNLCNCVS